MPFLFHPRRALVCLPALLPLAAWSAEAPSPQAFDKCARIGSSTDRLACYDQLAGRAPAPAVEAREQVVIPAPPVTSKLAPVDTAEAQVPQPASQGGSLLSKFWELDDGDKRGVFNFTGYRPNFILPLHYTTSINRAPQSPTQAVSPRPNYKHVEAEFQLSVRTKLLQDVGLPGGDLWAGFTQNSFWQVYNDKNSKPFRNTDYEVEMMYVVPVPQSWRQLPFGVQWRVGQLGLAHQSNGQSDPLSRSWNRAYLSTGFERGDWSLIYKFNRRFTEDRIDDNNPDLVRLRGRNEFALNWTPGAQTYSLTARSSLQNAHTGSLKFEFTTPIFRQQPNGIRWYIKLFSGYGETLTDYNFKQTSVGAGISFLQF